MANLLFFFLQLVLFFLREYPETRTLPCLISNLIFISYLASNLVFVSCVGRLRYRRIGNNYIFIFVLLLIFFVLACLYDRLP